MALKVAGESLERLVQAGAKVRDREPERAPRPIEMPPFQQPPPQAAPSNVHVDMEPVAKAIQASSQQSQQAMLLIAQAMSQKEAGPSAAPVTPIKGFDVQVVQRDVDGAIQRMKITVIR
jgi:hypothetical protein